MTVILSEVYDVYFHFAEPGGSIEHRMGNTVLALCSYRDIFWVTYECVH